MPQKPSPRREQARPELTNLRTRMQAMLAKESLSTATLAVRIHRFSPRGDGRRLLAAVSPSRADLDGRPANRLPQAADDRARLEERVSLPAGD